MNCSFVIGTWLILALLWIPLFFYAGMFYERVRWNELIQNGVLPKPTNRG